MSLTMIPHIHPWTPSTNVDYLCRLQMFTSNVDHSYICRTDQRPTYPWHFPSPYITSVIFSYITSVIWTNTRYYVFVWPIRYRPIPGIFLLFLLLHGPVSNFHSQSLIYHIQVSGTPQPIHFLKADDVSYPNSGKIQTQRQCQLQRQRRQGNKWINNSVLYFRNLDDSSIQKTTNKKQQQTTNNNKWQTMTNNKQRPTTNNNQPQTLTNDK